LLGLLSHNLSLRWIDELSLPQAPIFVNKGVKNSVERGSV